MAINYIFAAKKIAGGEIGALDRIKGDSIDVDDSAIVINEEGGVLFYRAFQDENAVENLPLIVIPDRHNTNNMAWALCSPLMDDATVIGDLYVGGNIFGSLEGEAQDFHVWKDLLVQDDATVKGHLYLEKSLRDLETTDLKVVGDLLVQDDATVKDDLYIEGEVHGISHDKLDDFVIEEHRARDDDTTSSVTLWSSHKINAKIENQKERLAQKYQEGTSPDFQDVTIRRDLVVQEDATTRGDLYVEGEIYQNGEALVLDEAQDFHIHRDLTVQDDATVKGDLRVEGVTHISTLTIDYDLAETQTLHVLDDLLVQNDATIKDSLRVGRLIDAQGVHIHRDLNVQRDATVIGDLQVQGINISPVGTTWISRSTVGDRPWHEVCYGNGLFVCVSTDGYIETSPDGINWTARGLISAQEIRRIIYGNGLFVAVCSSGANRIWTSVDTINWTLRAAPVANQWTGLTYANGMFVAVSIDGAGNRVMTSPDGITWTSRTSAADSVWQSVTYGNGLFVAVASSGAGQRVMTSPDGITWTGRDAAEANQWWVVRYGNGLFVAIGATGTGNRVMTSPDGVTWSIGVSAGDWGWEGLAYGNGLWVATNGVGGGGGQYVMTSPDGFDWTLRDSPADNNWYSVVYGNGMFVSVANSGTGNRVMTSGKQEFYEVSKDNIYQGGMDIHGRVLAFDDATIKSRLNVERHAHFTDNVHMYGDLQVEGLVEFRELLIQDDATVKDYFIVEGSSKFQNVDIQELLIQDDATVKNNITVEGKLHVGPGGSQNWLRRTSQAYPWDELINEESPEILYRRNIRSSGAASGSQYGFQTYIDMRSTGISNLYGEQRQAHCQEEITGDLIGYQFLLSQGSNDIAGHSVVVDIFPSENYGAIAKDAVGMRVRSNVQPNAGVDKIGVQVASMTRSSAGNIWAVQTGRTGMVYHGDEVRMRHDATVGENLRVEEQLFVAGDVKFFSNLLAQDDATIKNSIYVEQDGKDESLRGVTTDATVDNWVVKIVNGLIVRFGHKSG